MKTRCRCCRDLVSDASKRLEPGLGFVCHPCHAFLNYADKAMRKVGIEGLAIEPVRFAPVNPEPEAP